MSQIQELRLLADNGSPLTIATEKTGPYEQTVHVQDRGSYKVQTHLKQDQIARSLASDLQHYPHPLTINGETIETSPFEDLAQVSITSYLQHTTEYMETTFLPLVEGHFHLYRQNALIAGVLTNTIATNSASESVQYKTPGASPFSHWQPAHTARLRPISVVTRDELESLSDTELQLLLNQDVLLPLTSTIAQRDAEQVQRTMEHPKAPAKYEGPIHHYASSHPDGAHSYQPFNTGEPIIVHRTPVAISPEGMTNPEFISLAEAFYTTDQELVPVAQSDVPRDTLTDISLNIQVPKPEKGSPLQVAESITISAGLNKNPPTHHVEAKLWMTLDDLMDTVDKVSYIPGSMNTEYLSQTLIRAYWTDNNSISDSGGDDRMVQLCFEMHCLAKAALEDRDEAYQDRLQQHLDDFRPDLPLPSREITVRSPYHNLSMTYRPPSET